MRLGTIGVHHLRGNQFAIRTVERISLILGHGTRIDPCECAGRFYAHRANRITEQRGDRLNDGARWRGWQRARHRGSDQRTGIGDGSLDRGFRSRRGVTRQQQQSTRPRNRRLACIKDQLIKSLFRIDGSGPPGGQRSGVVRLGLTAVRVPSSDGVHRPVRWPVGMTLGARVRRADRCRQIRPRNAKAVIAPAIHHHVGLRGHMTVDALRTGTPGFVVMVLGRVEFRRHVALAAEPVTLGAQRQAVRLMAIRACDARMIHAALHEGAVFEHLAVDLAVGVIQARLQVGGGIGIEQRRAWLGILRNHPASRVACGARVEFRRDKWLRALGDAGLGVHLPVARVGGLQPVCQAFPICIGETRCVRPASACVCAQATCREPGP